MQQNQTLNTNLICVGGISAEPYIKERLLSTENYFSKNYNLYEFDYDKFLDRGLFGKIRFLDKYGDWFQFAIREGYRNKIRKCLRSVVGGLKHDCLAHSLGTWIVMGSCINFRNVYLFGSPFSSGLSQLKNTVVNELLRNWTFMNCERLYYVYNDDDVVCNGGISLGLLDKMSPNVKLVKCGSGHDIIQYVEGFII